MLTKRVKTATVKTVARHDKDTGSADVQVALLSRQIDELTKHLKKNKKDIHSRRGLLQMVADRRKHLPIPRKRATRSVTHLLSKNSV